MTKPSNTGLSDPHLIEVLLGALHLPGPNDDRWHELLKHGGALAAVIPVSPHQYTLIFRRPRDDEKGTRAESDNAFRQRASEARALAIVTADWQPVADEFWQLRSIEPMFHQAVIVLAALRSEVADKDEALAAKDEALAKADAALADKSELYDGLVAMLDTLTKRRKLTEQQFETLSRLVIERAIIARIEAFEARLVQFEARVSPRRKLELPPPALAPHPKPEGTPDVGQEA
jgi:hypothetical protein